jgi:hypothetical protein
MAVSPGGWGCLPIDERRLADRLADRIFERLANRLDEDSPARTPDLLDAAAVARLLGCERGWVYEHKGELGAVALAAGPRPRLRFPRARVEQIAGSADGDSQPAPQRSHPRRRRRASSTGAPLLEIKGRAP